MLNRPTGPGHQLAHPTSLVCRTQLSLTSSENNPAAHPSDKKPEASSVRSDRRRTKKAQHKDSLLNPEANLSGQTPFTSNLKVTKVLPSAHSEDKDTLLAPETLTLVTDRRPTQTETESCDSNSSVVRSVLCLLPARSKLRSLCGPHSIHQPDSFSKSGDPRLVGAAAAAGPAEAQSLGNTIKTANLNSNVLQEGQRVYLLSSKPQISLLHFASLERQSAGEAASSVSSQAPPPQPQQCLSSSRHLLAKRTRIEQSPASSGELVAEENLKRQKVECSYGSTSELQ